MKYLIRLMQEKDMNIAELSRESLIPETTVRDIVSGKADLNRCQALTVLCIAGALDTTVEDIMLNYWDEQETDVQESVEIKRHDMSSMLDFYMMVEHTMHKLRSCGEMGFVKAIREDHWIERFYMKGLYRSAFFLLGLVDYLCRKKHHKLAAWFDAYREECLDQPVYSLRTLEESDDADEYEMSVTYTRALAVPELARFNIYMTEKDITPNK